jgi:integrase
MYVELFINTTMEKNKSAATAYVILETRWANVKQIYKLKLMITHKRIQKFYTIIIPGVPATMTEEDFEKTKLDKPRKPFSDYKERIGIVESSARKVIMEMNEFSFEMFQKLYFDPPVIERNLFKAFEKYSADLIKEGRISTASSYNCALKSLSNYTTLFKIKSPVFDDVTVDFLNGWEKWMISIGNSPTTVGIYARNIRSILNQAKNAGLLKPANYPFGEKKFEIPAGENPKKALTVSEVGEIFNFILPDGSNEQRSRDLWIFSYLCNGINIKDIARLKYKNIDLDSISFVRAKTERKLRKKQRTIVIPLSPEIHKIIEKWGNKSKEKEQFIFPILFEGITPERERAVIQQTTKNINNHMDAIVKKLNWTKNVTTYTARHSFATVLKRSGASTEFISESLGHSNLATTENYLASFEMDTKRELAKNLTNFSPSKK